MNGATDKSFRNLATAVEHQPSTLRASWWPRGAEVEIESEGKREKGKADHWGRQGRMGWEKKTWKSQRRTTKWKGNINNEGRAAKEIQEGVKTPYVIFMVRVQRGELLSPEPLYKWGIRVRKSISSQPLALHLLKQLLAIYICPTK